MSIPYFPLYVTDFEADTSHLTLEEDGAYNRLLRLCWMTDGCSIPDDPKWIARRMRVISDDYDRVVAPLILEFFECRSGRVFSARLLAEFKKADKTSALRSAAGKKGGRPQRIENIDKDDKPGFTGEKPGFPTGARVPEPEPDKKEDSEANASGSEAAVANGEDDFAKQIFDRAVAYLGRHGTSPRSARAFVGMLRKSNPDTAILDAFMACGKAGAVDPIPWIRAKLSRPKTDLDAAFAQFLGAPQ